MVWSEDERSRNLWLVILVICFAKNLFSAREIFKTFCGFFCSPVRISARRATAIMTSRLPLTAMVGSFLQLEKDNIDGKSFHQWYLCFYLFHLWCFLLLFWCIFLLSNIFEIYPGFSLLLLLLMVSFKSLDVNHYKVRIFFYLVSVWIFQ